MWQSLSRWKENHRCLVDVTSLRVVRSCTVGTWVHGMDLDFFLCVFLSTPKKLGDGDIFSKFGPTSFSCLKKTTRKIVMNHGLKHMSVDFPTHISIAENRRVDSWQLSAFWGSTMEVSWSCYPGYWRSPLDDESSGINQGLMDFESRPIHIEVNEIFIKSMRF